MKLYEGQKHVAMVNLTDFLIWISYWALADWVGFYKELQFKPMPTDNTGYSCHIKAAKLV